MSGTKLDLTFRVGDKIKFNRIEVNTAERFLAQHGMPGEIGALEGERATVRWKHGPRLADYTQSEIPLRDLSFACHNHGAPFEKIILDEDEAYKDGYHSGLAIGLGMDGKSFYHAGGPHVGSAPSHGCRHLLQHYEFAERNNAAWRKGWAAGQERAKMAKPLDFTKPLRTVKDHKPVHYVGPINPDGDDHMVNIAYDNGPPPRYGQVPIAIDKFGSQGHGHYENVVENVPVPQTRYYAFDTETRSVIIDPRGVLNVPRSDRHYLRVVFLDGVPIESELVAP